MCVLYVYSHVLCQAVVSTWYPNWCGYRDTPITTKDSSDSGPEPPQLLCWFSFYLFHWVTAGFEIEEEENSEFILRSGTKYLWRKCQEMTPENKLVLDRIRPWIPDILDVFGSAIGSHWGVMNGRKMRKYVLQKVSSRWRHRNTSSAWEFLPVVWAWLCSWSGPRVERYLFWSIRTRMVDPTGMGFPKSWKNFYTVALSFFVLLIFPQSLFSFICIFFRSCLPPGRPGTWMQRLCSGLAASL